jgi:hypothetical protein
MHAKMNMEDLLIHSWLNTNDHRRKKRFLASLGAFAVGGAITFAAEQISHLFGSSATYNNEKVMAEHIRKTEQEVHHLGVLDAQFQEAIKHTQHLIENQFTEEKLDVFLIKVDQILEKLVEDHRTMVHQMQDLIVNVLHPGLFSLNAVDMAMSNLNTKLSKDQKKILLQETSDIFQLPFTVVKESASYICCNACSNWRSD